MKLYSVNVEMTVVVWAEDEDAAIDKARECLDDEANHAICHAEEINYKNEIPIGWEFAFPHGGGGKQTCFEIVSRGVE